jgi:hypothetical protein
VSRPKYIILKLLMVFVPLLLAVTPVMAQDTVYTGQTTPIAVNPLPGVTYTWELYNDVTGINFATDPGNCPASQAYFTAGQTGPSVSIMWLAQGTYFYKVKAVRGGCTMNLKVGKMVVLWEIPTATLEPPPPICVGDSVHLRVHLTGTAPWSITLTDGVNSFVFTNIMSTPFDLTVPISPVTTTTYWISQVSDANVTNTVPSPPVIQVVNPKPVNSKIYQYEP